MNPNEIGDPPAPGAVFDHSDAWGGPRASRPRRSEFGSQLRSFPCLWVQCQTDKTSRSNGHLEKQGFSNFDSHHVLIALSLFLQLFFFRCISPKRSKTNKKGLKSQFLQYKFFISVPDDVAHR